MHKKFEPSMRVWKLKQERTCKEYKSMVSDNVLEEEWKYLDVNEHWQDMKKIMMEIYVECQKVLADIMKRGGMRRLLKTVWEKKIKCRKWDRKLDTWKKSRQSAKKVISSTKEKKQKECASDLNDLEQPDEIFRMAKQVVKERQDTTGSNCLQGVSGKVIVDDKGLKICGRSTWKTDE